MAKGEDTRRLIVETAIGLFGEHGYEKTTMRAIASAAGVSVGNAYYYFDSKEALVQEFYLELQRRHLAALEPVLHSGQSFGEQLRAILLEGLAVWSPYHSFAGRFIGLAAMPDSPNSPFSDASAEARRMATDLYVQLVARTELKMDPELRAELPELLWLLQLGLVAYWVHDKSDGQRRTRMVIDRSVPLLEKLIGYSRVKVLRPVTGQALALYRLVRHTPEPSSPPAS